MSNQIRDVLNKIKWTDDLGLVKIWYLHRGVPDDEKVVEGDLIVSIGKSFFYTKDSAIPFHRVLKIVYKDKVIFDRSQL